MGCSLRIRRKACGSRARRGGRRRNNGSRNSSAFFWFGNSGEIGEISPNYGPIAYGGALWAFTLIENFDASELNPNPDGRLGVYRSSDGGHTWVRQDLARVPTALPVYTHIYWDVSSATVTIVYTTNASTPENGYAGINLVDFNMATGTFGTPYATAEFFVQDTDAVLAPTL